MELPKTMKTLALVSTVALGIAMAGPAHAQNETVGAQLITSSAITSTLVSGLDFGEYLIQNGAGDTVTLTLNNTGAPAVAVAGVVDPTTQVVQITAPATQGVVNVQTPAPSSLTMTRDSSNDFGDGNLSLTAVTFATASETGNIDSDLDTGTITVLAGATDETITFGGETTASGTPADATHTADFTISFAY